VPYGRGLFVQTVPVQWIDSDDALRWVRSAARDPTAGETAGFDLEGWEDSAWVLHTMFEDPRIEAGLSYQDVHRKDLNAGAVAPLVVGNINVDDKAILTGIPLGRTEDPGQGWIRLRWTDLASRIDAPMARCGYPPCHRWFPGPSWPANVRPPSEGSLDRTALQALLEVLARYSQGGLSTPVTGYYVTMATRAWDHARVFAGRLEEVEGLYDDDAVVASPTNFWSSDRTWFVYTDWDLLGTKVSGSADLVDGLRDNPDLELIRFP
jgi:hypothetical protein